MADRKVLPYPTSQQERTAAKKAHLDAIKAGKSIPHFIDANGSYHYWDNKGSGRLQLNNLGTKLMNEANRRAKKLNATPTELDYIDVFGLKNGKALYKQEVERLRKIYSSTPSSTHDVDHINSLGDKGVHHSRNLRAQNSSRNRSEGQRGLSAAQKNMLMLASKPKDQIALQGPRPTPRVRQAITRGAFEVGGGVVRRVGKTLVPAAAGGIALSTAELAQRSQQAYQTGNPLDMAQAGISAVEVAADGAAVAGWGSGVGAPVGAIAEGVSTVAGLTNGAVDAVRHLAGGR